MLTAHECIRLLAGLREAVPRVSYRWPHTPVSVSIDVGRLSFSVVGRFDAGSACPGWAVLGGNDDDNEIWPPHLSDRIHDAVDEAMARAGVDARVRRPMGFGIPF